MLLFNSVLTIYVIRVTHLEKKGSCYVNDLRRELHLIKFIAQRFAIEQSDRQWTKLGKGLFFKLI